LPRFENKKEGILSKSLCNNHMKNKINIFDRKLLLSIYGINILINLKSGLNIDGSKIKEGF
jgi:hypothetical protein